MKTALEMQTEIEELKKQNRILKKELMERVFSYTDSDLVFRHFSIIGLEAMSRGGVTYEEAKEFVDYKLEQERKALEKGEETDD